MCCVMPPASVSTTAVLRIASSSVVLPWSTWPMIVTTGGRGTSDSSASSYDSGSASSSPACLIVTSRSSSSGDQLDLVVGERLGRGLHLAQIHQHLDDLRHRDPERLREVAHGDAGLDGDRPGGRSDLARRLRDAIALAVAGTLALARAGPPAAAVDDDAALPVPGPPPPLGLIGLPPGMCSSVEPREGMLDADGPPQTFD